jgi:hypothetical protein
MGKKNDNRKMIRIYQELESLIERISLPDLKDELRTIQLKTGVRRCGKCNAIRPQKRCLDVTDNEDYDFDFICDRCYGQVLNIPF